MNNDALYQRRTKGVMRTPIAVVLCMATFIIGIAYGGYIAPSSTSFPSLKRMIERISNTKNVDLSTFSATWDLIESKYVGRPVDANVLLGGAVSGLVNSLNDPYSYYLSPEESKRFDEDLNGNFEGIGAELGVKENAIVIIAPLSGTPAERAGLRSGDIIKQIDGVTTVGLSLDEAVKKIRGPQGSSVTLSILRDNTPVQEFTIQREKIQTKSVSVEYSTVSTKVVAVIAITSFSHTTAQEFTQIAHDVVLRQPHSIVLDLRNNTGGYLDAAVQIADDFLTDGTVVIEDFGHDSRETITAEPGALLVGYPLVILTNGGTASAAEILAGALEDRLQAITVGEKTFGKGSVQELEPLTDGATVKITIAHWLTPNGRSIEGKGLDPKITVTLSEKDVQARKDPQLQRALEEAVAR